MPDESFPRQSARTRRFTLGEPRAVTVTAAGTRLLFLRSLSGTDPRTALWAVELPGGDERMVVDPTAEPDGDLPAEELARRERAREQASGVVAYSVDDAGRTAVFALAGRLYAVDVDSGGMRSLPSPDGIFDPRIDPSGRRVAYVAGRSLRCIDIDGSDDRQLVGEDDADVSWGRPEHVAAEEMDRSRGFWWAPDGESLLVCRVDERDVPVWWISDPAHPTTAPRAVRYPAAGTSNAAVTLHHIGLDGSRTRVRWDDASLPYLGRVTWTSGGPPLLQAESRDQRRISTMSVDVVTGDVQELAEDVDPTWVELVGGVPAWWRGRLVRVTDRGGARRLLVDDDPVTPEHVHVRSVLAVADDGVVVSASYDDPTQVHLARWDGDSLVELTTSPGVHAGVFGCGVSVISSASLEWTGMRHVVVAGGVERNLASVAERPVVTPSVRLVALGQRQLRAGIVLPRDHRPGTRLPVLMDPYGGPHAQRVVAARSRWLEPQWLADQGFAVVVADGRGTPGRGAEWERAIAGDFSVTLDDQVDALHAAAEIEADLDLARVAIRGWSFGGYLAALAVLRRPDVFHAAVAGAPVTDWCRYDTFYTERYLGDPNEQPLAYPKSSLLDDAGALERPLLVVHGLADDNVVAAHSLLLSQRLTEAGRPHSFLPLTGVTHMTPQEEVAENLLLLQMRFLKSALGIS